MDTLTPEKRSKRLDSARELKAGERVGKPRTTHNEPAPDRRGLSLKQQLERWSSP